MGSNPTAPSSSLGWPANKNKGIKMISKDIIDAHKHSTKHREKVQRSQMCGCFHCCRFFKPIEILKWVDNGETAICPFCGIDSIIGSNSNYRLTTNFLTEMRNYWFSERKKSK